MWKKKAILMFNLTLPIIKEKKTKPKQQFSLPEIQSISYFKDKLFGEKKPRYLFRKIEEKSYILFCCKYIHSSIKAEVSEIHGKWPVAHLGICSPLSRLCRLPTEQMLLWGHFHSEHKSCQSQVHSCALSCTSILLPESRND